MHPVRSSLWRVLLSVALVATACGGGGGGGGGATAPGAARPTTTVAPAGPTPDGSGPGGVASPASTAPPAAVAAVPEVLRFTATGIDGSPVVGADYAGKDVALWFWAPW